MTSVVPPSTRAASRPCLSSTRVVGVAGAMPAKLSIGVPPLARSLIDGYPSAAAAGAAFCGDSLMLIPCRALSAEDVSRLARWDSCLSG